MDIEGATRETESGEDGLSPEVMRRAMRRTIIGQCLGVPLYVSLGIGGLATLYAIKFDAKDLMVGMINAGLWGGFVVACFMSGVVERHNKKAVLLTGYGLATACVAVLIVLPRAGAAWSPAAARAIMAAAILLYACCEGAASAAWFPWVFDLVPRRRVGKYFSRLRTAWQSMSLAVYVGMAFILGPKAPPSRFQIVLLVLILGTVLRIVLMAGVPQRPVRPSGLVGVMQRVRMMLGDAQFRPFLLFSTFARGLSRVVQPSMAFYMRGVLGFSDLRVMGAIGAGMLAAAASFVFWGRLADRRGSGATYRIGFVLVCVGCMLWLPASFAIRGAGRPDLGYALLVVASCLLGLGDAAVGIGVTRQSFLLTPRDRAATYLNLHPNITLMVFGVQIFAVGAILGWLDAAKSTAWLNPYVIVFAANGVLALVLYPLIRWVPRSDEAA